jgi:hypothetical protein
MLEEEKLLINDNNNDNNDNDISNNKNNFMNAIQFYIRQTKMLDWLIISIVIGAIIATIIIFSK